MFKKYKVLIIVCILAIVGVGGYMWTKSETEPKTKEIPQGVLNEVSYEKMIENISMYNEISIEDAKKQFSNQSSSTTKYYELIEPVEVTEDYHAAMYFSFLIEKDSSGTSTVKEVTNACLVTSNLLDNNIKAKEFAGNVAVHLQDHKTVYYDINGDFCNLNLSTSTSIENADGVVTLPENNETHQLYKYVNVSQEKEVVVK